MTALERGRLCFFITLILCIPSASARSDDQRESARLIGSFKVSYYYLVTERERGEWPLFSSSCGEVITLTSSRFHGLLSREGSGRLLDGRIVNFEERCGCARPGFMGVRKCYSVLDRAGFPWGRGARLNGLFVPLRPFRSVAVDPALIPLGSHLYIPFWQGKRAPDGRMMDGCFRAEDTGALITHERIDFFGGSEQWAEWLRKTYRPERVEVYRGEGRCPAAVK